MLHRSVTLVGRPLLFIRTLHIGGRYHRYADADLGVLTKVGSTNKLKIHYGHPSGTLGCKVQNPRPDAADGALVKGFQDSKDNIKL